MYYGTVYGRTWYGERAFLEVTIDLPCTSKERALQLLRESGDFQEVLDVELWERTFWHETGPDQRIIKVVRTDTLLHQFEEEAELAYCDAKEVG